MTSTQEPNTMAPQSALCICSRKWKAKLIVPIYFGTKTSEFCLRIICFSSLESELSFDSEDSKINFDRARSTTAKYVLQFSRQNTGIDPAIENHRIVWTFMFEAARRHGLRKQPSFFAPGPSGVSLLFSQARRKLESSISNNYRFHIVTGFKS